jgi:hypothetical protein
MFLLVLFFSLIRAELAEHNILLVGRWTDQEVVYVYTGIVRTGYRMMETLEVDINTNPIEVFARVHNITPEKPFIIEHYNLNSVGGRAWAYNHIGFLGFYKETDYKQKSINLVIHELGHAFEYLIEREMHRDRIPCYVIIKEKSFPVRPQGYCGTHWTWQQSTSLNPREEYADMYIGWVYGCWQDSPAGIRRREFMDFNMSLWLRELRRSFPYCEQLICMR